MGYTFNNKDIQKKATEKAATPEARKKAEKTKAENRLIKAEIFNNLKTSLLSQDGRSKSPYYAQFLDNFLKEAKKDPGGKCGSIVAQTIFHQDLLEMLDEAQEKEMARDLDFMRYRATKRLFREQRDVVLDVDKRKKCIFCSRRAGKTDSNSTNLIYSCITPNTPCLYINLTFSNAINQMFDMITDQAEEIGLPIEKQSKSEGFIFFSNGSSIKFSGNSNNAEADKLRGGKYRLIIIDEAGHQRNMKYLIDEVLGPCLMDYEDSQLVLTGTPPKIPHTYAEKCWNSKEYEHYHWDMSRNPYIHNVDEEIERICKEKGIDKNSSFIQREYFGIVGAYDTEAQVFKGRHTYDELPVDNIGVYDLPFTPTNIVIGVDFGYVDNNAVITLAYNKDTRQSIVLPNEDLFNQSTISDIISKVQKHYEMAKSLAMKYDTDLSTIEIFCDNNEKSIVSEMARTYNLPSHCCWKYQKDMALNQLAEELRTGRMTIYKNGHLNDEMEQVLYKRDEETDAILPELDEDLGIHPDAVFALLYASRQAMLDMGLEAGGRSRDEKL